MRRIAIVGSGIAGLAAAHRLAPHAQVTLFEAGTHFGGHTHTVELTLPDRSGHPVTHGVDTGFLVFNHRTYPELVQLFAELQVDTAPSDMSFSVQLPSVGLEWSGSSLDTVFAQRRNLWRAGFWRMLRDLLRFNRLTTALARQGHDAALAEPIGAFLDRHAFGAEFRQWYFLPMVACIWSCPADQMLRFPMGTMIRFCHNHGLLQITDRPQWYTVRGGAKHYVAKILAGVADARLNTPVRQVRRLGPGPGDGGVMVCTDRGSERYDDVVLACHSDQALALLAEPLPLERELLGAIGYHANVAVLHTDTGLLPRRRKAWAAWNYERAPDVDQEAGAVCLHYWLNRLQPLPFRDDVIVSLNPVRPPRDDKVLGRYEYAHPVFDGPAVAAQRRLDEIQGVGHVWFCGAWTGYGFHEDGLRSGQAVAQRLLAACQRASARAAA
ncbi:MAG: FAD-dependent oxidoreductase [Caldimonas sp.]|uniref:NAD(P)/FAD-dependent oxidoreductase n=1 Tax=Caldimonas taiwanensis TaxID=307483 RepID=UPI000785C463|nr:FAD-dependent oxidoreductase [Caldimonas taiwanensis]GIX25970.1 MAG: FAD-dependent oxidoreductase [Caldimonas sp.]